MSASYRSVARWRKGRSRKSSSLADRASPQPSPNRAPAERFLNGEKTPEGTPKGREAPKGGETPKGGEALKGGEAPPLSILKARWPAVIGLFVCSIQHPNAIRESARRLANRPVDWQRGNSAAQRSPFADRFLATQPGFSRSMPSFAKNATTTLTQQRKSSRNTLTRSVKCRFSPRMRHFQASLVTFCGKLGIEF